MQLALLRTIKEFNHCKLAIISDRDNIFETLLKIGINIIRFVWFPYCYVGIMTLNIISDEYVYNCLYEVEYDYVWEMYS